MRDVIKKLIKEYYDTDIIIRDMVVQESKGKQVINIFSNLASNKWNLFENNIVNPVSGLGKPDLQMTEKILEGRRQLKAEQIYRMAKDIMVNEGKDAEFHRLWKETEPKENDAHVRLITYSLRALFFMDILTPYEYEMSEPAFDESGHLLGMKQLPREKDEVDIGMEDE